MSLPLILIALVGFVEQEQHEAIEYLREENRILKGAVARPAIAADR
jgi:hypothetical protein